MSKPWIWKIYIIGSTETNMCYIGQTKRTLNMRFEEHKQKAMEGSHNKLYKAMRRYGIDTFSIQLIKDNILTPEEADYWEKYYILQYDSFHNGLNMTIGGEGVYLLDWNDMGIVLGLYNTGYSIRQIAGRMNISPEDVEKSLIYYGWYRGPYIPKGYLGTLWDIDPNFYD